MASGSSSLREYPAGPKNRQLAFCLNSEFLPESMSEFMSEFMTEFLDEFVDEFVDEFLDEFVDAWITYSKCDFH